jgi:hypothetical protein
LALHVFLVQVARAAPALFAQCVDHHHRPISARDYILHHLPLVEAHGLLHTAAILDGTPMIWPDPQLSKRGRWWKKLRQLWSPAEPGMTKPELGMKNDKTVATCATGDTNEVKDS